MQTFLPYPDFQASVRCLDDKRLGKQRAEAKQILLAITDPEHYGWQKHPAVNMWRQYAEALALYGLAACAEWVERGFRDCCAPCFTNCVVSSVCDNEVRIPLPRWFGDERLHASHRAALFRKDPVHYAVFNKDQNSEGYWWPTCESSS